MKVKNKLLMKRIVILTLFFLGFFFQTSSALSYTDSKRDTIVIDSIALTQHLSHTFARFYPLSLLQRIYAYRKKWKLTLSMDWEE